MLIFWVRENCIRSVKVRENSANFTFYNLWEQCSFECIKQMLKLVDMKIIIILRLVCTNVNICGTWLYAAHIVPWYVDTYFGIDGDMSAILR